MDFRVLGPLEAYSERGKVELGGPKPRAVLGVLLLHANQPVSAERLAIALEGENASPTAPKRVQVHVSRLRKALGDGDILTRGPAGYRLRVRPGELDSERFGRLFEDGRRALALGQTEHAATVLREALALWRGAPLAELAFDPVEQTEIARLEERRLAAVEACIEADLAVGRHAALVGELRQLVADNPTREKLAGQLMLALYRCGRQAEALETYREARSRLVEVGVEPGPELRRLQMAILRQDASLEPPSPVADLPRELDASTAPPLVGREAELAWLRERWERARDGNGALVRVTGAFGIGKTRLAAELAGEAHRLGATTLYAEGAGPAQALLIALDRACKATHPTLLVVDDADRAEADALAKLDESIGALSGVPLMALATGEDAEGLARLGGDGALRLEPLDADAVGAIAALYAPGSVAEEVPAEWLLTASRGIPRRVHEVASQWARREAAQRVGAVAGRAAAGRAELRSMEAELAGGVEELQAAGERLALVGDEGAPVVCPFKGLAPFEVADAEYFFGRERLVAELVARLVGTTFLGVVGPSGSGKSSVVRAGLLPALAGGVLPGSEKWTQVLMRPGEHPLEELRGAAAGVSADQKLVLAVDQFEETFTACRDEDERTAFISELARASRRGAGAVVVVALRADYYGRCADYPELSRLLAANHVLVGSMRHIELRRAVVGPAERVGLHVEPDLAEALVNDVEDEPGALPLLSTALLELWQRRDGRRLRLASYEDTGGVHGAVARLAEEAFGRLDEAQQALARTVLLRLAEVEPEGGVERRRLPLDELESEGGEEVASVVALLADARLLTVSAGSVEFAHEALLREWPRLSDWIEDDREDLRIHRNVSSAAQEWLRLGRDEDALHRGARLAEARDWAERGDPGPTGLEREFLAASLDCERRGRRARRRWLTIAFGGLALALVAIAAVAIVAVNERNDAERQRNIAVSQRLAATATNALDDDPALSLRLALRALNAAPTSEAEVALRQATLETRTLATLRGHRGRVLSASFSPDGHRAVSGGIDGTVRVWDLDLERPVATIRGEEGSAQRALFSPDGERIAIASDDGTVAITDAAGRDRAVRLRERGVGFWALAFSPNGKHLAIGADNGDLYLVPTDGGPARILRGHRDGVLTVRFSSDGSRIVSGDFAGWLRVWDVASGGSEERFAHRYGVSRVAFGRDDRRIISAGLDGRIRIWNAAGGAEPTVLKDPGGVVFAAAASADDRLVAAGGPDGTVRIWDVGSHVELAALRGHRGDVIDVGFSRTGDRIITAGEDGTVRLWRPPAQRVFPALPGIFGAALTSNAKQILVWGEGGIEIVDVSHGDITARMAADRGTISAAGIARNGKSVIGAAADDVVRVWSAGGRFRVALRAHTRQVNGASFSPDGRRAVTGGDDGRVIVWSLEDSIPVSSVRHGAAVNAVSFSHDGKRVLSAGADGVARIWRSDRQGRSLAALKGNGHDLNAASFSRDGRRVVTGAADGAVMVWDVAGEMRLLRGHVGQVTAVAFSADGTRIASAGGDGTVRVWDASTGKPLVILARHAGGEVVSVGFTPDGRDVMSAGADGIVRMSRCEACGSLSNAVALARERIVR